MASLLTLAATGFAIGVSTALSPGPLMALVIGETLSHGLAAGAVIAMTPVLTDLPMIVVSVLFAKSGQIPPWALGIISLSGAGLLMHIGWQNLHVRQQQLQSGTLTVKKSLLQAMMVNVLNPYPYIFWFSIATPMFSQTNGVGITVLSASLVIGVVVAMLGIAFTVSIARTRYTKYIPRLTRILGGVLMLFALLLFKQGIEFLMA